MQAAERVTWKEIWRLCNRPVLLGAVALAVSLSISLLVHRPTQLSTSAFSAMTTLVHCAALFGLLANIPLQLLYLRGRLVVGSACHLIPPATMLIGTLAFAERGGIIAVSASAVAGGAIQCATLWSLAKRQVSSREGLVGKASGRFEAEAIHFRQIAVPIALAIPFPFIPVFERYALAITDNFTSVAIISISWSIVSAFWGLLIRGVSLASIFHNEPRASTNGAGNDQISVFLIRYLVVVVLPAAVLLAARGTPLLEMLLLYGKIQPGDVAVLADVLQVHVITVCLLAAYTFMSRRLFVAHKSNAVVLSALLIPMIQALALVMITLTPKAVTPISITPVALAIPLFLILRQAVSARLLTRSNCVAALALGVLVLVADVLLLEQSEAILGSYSRGVELIFASLGIVLLSSVVWFLGDRYGLP